MKIDLTKLAPVSAHRRKATFFDLQYREKSGKWRVSEIAFARLNLSNMGFNLMLDPDSNVVFQVVLEDDAQILRRRSNTTAKGKEFTSDSLRTLLDSKFDGVNDFRLTDVGELEGTSFVAIEPWSKEMTVTTTTKVTTEFEEDDEETKEMVDAVAAEAETAKTIDDVENVTPVDQQLTEDDDSSGEIEKKVINSSSKDLDLEDIPETKEEEKKPAKNPFNSF